MNTFVKEMDNLYNYKLTENGAIAYKSTLSPVYDLFAFGAAYRKRSDEDCIALFKNAYEKDPNLALKCLFYIRDVRGGQGERRFFRTCFKWFSLTYSDIAKNFIKYLPEYGRWDDLFILFNTPLEKDMTNFIKNQLMIDMSSKKNGISLLAKWMPSENTSSKETKALARKFIHTFNITSKQYRLMLSKLRNKIKVLERLMSTNRWEEIEFDKIPSKAGLIYKNVFAHKDIIAKKYEEFISNKNTKVHASTLYPYEVVEKALSIYSSNLNDINRLAVNKYWENLPDYLNGKNSKTLCVIDTSGSMCGTPINVALSLGMYCAERIGEPFTNRFITFSRCPRWVTFSGADFVHKVKQVYRMNICENTNLEAVFDLILNTIRTSNVKEEDLPENIVIISDMEIDSAFNQSSNRIETTMDRIRTKWLRAGYKMPRLVYWNVDARHNTILDKNENISYVSGFSPIIFKQVLTGKTGWELMIETICSNRYNAIHI